MGDHLALLVDRMLTESTLAAAIESRKQAQCSSISAAPVDLGAHFAQKMNGLGGSVAWNLVECRICQEEDDDSNMEAPCSCCGSLKYAHRKCIQRWCNEKGDTVCEICLQQFKPDYMAPPKLFHYGSIPMNFRGSWEISRHNFHDSQIMTMVPSSRGLDYDTLAVSSTRSMIYCRSLTIVFVVLLVLRHTLPLLVTGAEQSLTLITLFLFWAAGILLSTLVLLRAVNAFCRRRQQQATHQVSNSSLEGEPQPHITRV